MSSTLIALMFGAGVAAFVWSKLARMTGNAKPMNVAIGSLVVGLIAFFVCYTLFSWILHI